VISKSENIQKLEQLFNDYYAALLLYGQTIVKENAAAEDIVQQAFILLWQKMDNIDLQTSPRAYLYKTVYNASLDFLKHEKVKNRYENETVRHRFYALNSNNCEENELLKKLEDALNDLPEQCGKIFKMSRFEDLKYREIAAKLGISEKTVENQMGKALKILRETMKEYLPLCLILFNL
jgi:RNA polymerase sigma-70 factor, ECF subfamily